jgi:uncharacterized protein (DUF983 family)
MNPHDNTVFIAVLRVGFLVYLLIQGIREADKAVGWGKLMIWMPFLLFILLIYFEVTTSR